MNKNQNEELDKIEEDLKEEFVEETKKKPMKVSGAQVKNIERIERERLEKEKS